MRLQLLLVLFLVVAAAALVPVPSVDFEAERRAHIESATLFPHPDLTLRVTEVRDNVLERDESLESVKGTPLDASTVALLLERLPHPTPRSPALGGGVPTWKRAWRSAADSSHEKPSADRPVEATRDPLPPAATLVSARSRASAGPPQLHVLRHTVATHAVGDRPAGFTVTFSRPLVALASRAALAEKDVPLRISPPLPAGRWEWQGTSKLSFIAAAPFQPSTRYTVEAPRGTRALDGSSLRAAASWSFDTPTVRCVRATPDTDLGVKPLIALHFDQAVDPQDVAAHVRVLSKRFRCGVTLASAAEIDADRSVREAVYTGRTAYLQALFDTPDVWGRMTHRVVVVVKPTEPLELDHEYIVEVGAGVGSKEGVLKAQAAQSLSIHTLTALRIRAHDRFPPDELSIVFTNALHARGFEVLVTPAVRGMSTSVDGTSLELRGPFDSKKRYRVEILHLRDKNLQELTGKCAVTFDPQIYERVDLPSSRHTSLDGHVPADTSDLSAIRLTGYAVKPRDWPAYQAANGEGRPAGRLLGSRTVAVRDGTNRLDVSDWLRAAGGDIICVVSSLRAPKVESTTWVSGTSLHLLVQIDRRSLLAWVTSEKDGRPQRGARVRLGDASAMTDARGLARIPLPAKAPAFAMAERGGEHAFAEMAPGARAQPPRPVGFWHVSDDRGTYRDGEVVHVKGWLRTRRDGSHGPLHLPPSQSTVAWALRDRGDRVLVRGRSLTDDRGGFDLRLALPPKMEPGKTTLSLYACRQTYTHLLSVEEFRRPEFEVTAASSQARCVRGEGGDVWVTGRYYAGGSIAGAPVTWEVEAECATYTPPGRASFVFGMDAWLRARPVHVNGKADATGKDRLHVDVASLWPPTPVTIHARAAIQDVNRQAWTSETSLLVHPSRVYVGLALPIPHKRGSMHVVVGGYMPGGSTAAPRAECGGNCWQRGVES